MRTPFIVERGSPTPLHRQIYDGWRRGILAGRFRGGDRVPSTRELAAVLSVSRVTVTAAHDQLVAEGYFEPVRGSGTFVAREIPDQPIAGRRRTAAGGAAPPVRWSAYARRLQARPPAPPPVPGVIDLSAAGPDVDHFPFDLWRRLLGRQFRRRSGRLAQPTEHPAGDPLLRQEIAAYVRRSRAVQCDAEQVIVASGSQQALDLCMRMLVDPGDAVALEDPSYPGTRQLAAAHGAAIRPVAVDREGIRVADLGTDTRLVCVTPSHQFPTGASMSLRRRLDLIEWARVTGAVIIEDDYDSEYRYSGPPLPALQGLSAAAAIVYIGTFSNVMFPGLRIGFAIVPPALAAPFAHAKSIADRYTPLLEQAALADFIREGHLERHIRRMRRLYGRRRAVLVEALARHFGDQAVVRGDAAGMHALVRFATRDLLQRAARAGVQMKSADTYYLSGTSPHEFIIGFSASGERALAAGVKRLAPAATRGQSRGSS